jgi:PAS domain-containing protein
MMRAMASVGQQPGSLNIQLLVDSIPALIHTAGLACLASGGVFEYETRVHRADGEYRWMFHRKVPLQDERGTIVKWYGSL